MYAPVCEKVPSQVRSPPAPTPPDRLVKERSIGWKRTITCGLRRTIQVRWHRGGFVVIRELLLEPIRPTQRRPTSTQWVSGAAGQGFAPKVGVEPDF